MDKKTIIAILFSIAFILAWDKYVVKKTMKPKQTANAVEVEKQVNQDVKESENLQKTDSVEDTETSVLTDTEVPQESLTSGLEEDVPQEDVVLENNVTKLTFSNKGGVLVSAILKNYKDKDGNNIELVNKEGARRGFYPFTFTNSDLTILNNKNFKINKDGNSVVFTYQSGSLFFEKKFTLADNNYNVIFSLNTSYNNDVEISLGPGIKSAEKVKSRYSGIQDQIVLFSDGDLEKYEKKKIKKNLGKTFKASWGAIEDRYYTKLIDNKDLGIEVKFDIKKYSEGEDEYSLSDLIFKAPKGQNFSVFIGPKQYEVLKSFGRGYEKTVNFGFFGLFGKWLFFFLRWLNGFVHNYGWSIVIMTIIIRALLFPLNQMSMKSMKKMGELQPKIKEIQAKYKKYGSDNTMKMKMNQEIAELYKKEGVNPAGGCLPMLVQMPVFFAIWGVLLSLIDLQNAPFIFWITDLSSKDPYYVLPVLMGVTQFISQLITPTTGDKNQKMMMYAMPVVITAMLANAPSGLMVYWTTNNLFQVVQQLIINYQSKKEQS